MDGIFILYNRNNINKNMVNNLNYLFQNNTFKAIQYKNNSKKL